MYDYKLLEQIDKIRWGESCFLFLFCFVIAHAFNNGIFYWVMVIFACVIFVKLSKLIVENERIFNITQYLAGFSFFLYAIHTPLLDELIKRIWLPFLPMKNTFFSLLEYFGVTFLVICIGTGIGIALKKIFPKLFGLLTGGRQ